jgi:1,4-dihydroxy-2-naphthoate octaprenyltransferase
MREGGNIRAEYGRQPAKDGRLTPAILWSMTTPWAIFLSALMPAVFGVVMAFEQGGDLQVWKAVLVLLIPCLLNAGVNLVNDYYDYINGNDTPENIVAKEEGPLAYHRILDARPARTLGFLLFGAAAVLGIAVLVFCSMKPLLIGVIGAGIALTYSGSKVSTSHLPVGEPLSGFTLGGLVPLAVTAALTDHLYWMVLWKAVPMMLIVTMFMLDNNTCDMVRDEAAGRKTLPILIGREASERLAHVLTVLWMGLIFGILAVWYPGALPFMAAAVFICRKGLAGIFRVPRTRDTKMPATMVLTQVAFSVAIGYPVSIWLHLLLFR